MATIISTGAFSCLHLISARFNSPVRASATARRSAGNIRQPSIPTPPAPSGTDVTLKDYVECSKNLIGWVDGGPPRWFSPLDCASPMKNSPLLLYLPGIDGVGLGLMMYHKRLGRIFDVWCLHVPVTDRTSFTELVHLVEVTVRSEHCRAPTRPIYLLGESLGGCLALAVAARNRHIDLALILANPATRLHGYLLQNSIMLSEFIQGQLQTSMVNMLSAVTGISTRMAMVTPGAEAFSSYLSVLVDVLPVETLIWRLKMIKSAADYVNSRLHAVKAQSLILSSGKDQFLPSQEEGERLHKMLPNCEIQTFNNSGHALLLEDSFDLVTVIRCANFYRRGRHLDYVTDYVPPTPSEFEKMAQPHRWTEVAVNAVMISTLENGKIVRGLTGIPSEGPVILVGYHMLLASELVPLSFPFWTEKRIVPRGIAHPMFFEKQRQGRLPPILAHEYFRFMGAVPVSATNFYKLLSSKSHILLFPGGIREALHRKGEEYKLFWPEQSEFVRMAARFGAKIIPFGTVGEDDIGQILLDYDDLVKVPVVKAIIEEQTDELAKIRKGIEGEVANQPVHLPIILPKVPGRFYCYFGKPIETEGRREELRSKEKADELYLEVKSEVERCIRYLKEKRENDPYRNIVARLLYQATHGFHSQVPTFHL